MDKIFIHGLRCTAHIGCKEDERAYPQALILDVTLELDFSEAAVTDNLENTVNYARLSKALIQTCEDSECQLIETLVYQLARQCLSASERVQRATVLLKKPAGLPNGEYAAVETTVERENLNF